MASYMYSPWPSGEAATAEAVACQLQEFGDHENILSGGATAVNGDEERMGGVDRGRHGPTWIFEAPCP